jgi:hypothetical protein
MGVTLGLVICCIAIGGAALPLIIFVSVLGVLVSFTMAPDPNGETGIRIIERNSLGKHSVQLEASRSPGTEPKDSAGRPILICPRCGHREDYVRSSMMREQYMEEKYQEAKQRLEAHMSARHR